MASLNATQIADMVASTLYELGRMKFQQIGQNLQDYEVFGSWFKQDKVTFDEGIGIQKTLMNKIDTSARHKGLMATDTVDIPDLLDQIQVPWRHADTYWAFIHQETLMNRGKSLVLDVIKPRRASAMISLIEQLEEKAWSSPDANNTTDPYGIPYWVVKNATTGFNGGLPSGHSTVGGVSLTDSPTFKNYTFQYTGVTKADLIKSLRTAKRKCNFKSPIKANDYSDSRTGRYRLYSNETTIADVEDVGEAQNENLGRDIASVDGEDITFRRHPWKWIPQLDTDTTNPVYGIDHSTFIPYCLKGDYLRESGPHVVAGQHNVFQVHVDITYNYVCLDRRRNWVAYV